MEPRLREVNDDCSASSAAVSCEPRQRPRQLWLEEPARPEELEEPFEPSCFPAIESDDLRGATISRIAAGGSAQSLVSADHITRLFKSFLGKAGKSGTSNSTQSLVSAERVASLFGSFVRKSGKSGTLESCGNVVSAATSFADPQLRRGMLVTALLSQCGQVLRSSEGSASTFEMSQPVRRLDCFVSHNWSVGRVPKFLALAYYFNLHAALVACFLCSTTTGLLLALGLLGARPGSKRSWPLYVCLVVAVSVFLTVLLFGHEMQACICRHRRRHHNRSNACARGQVFLDKTCIHQTDAALQRKGIESLAAYLLVSDTMLVVYTEIYLQKLWTVYELASMLCLKQSPRIRVVPTDLVKYFFMQLLAVSMVIAGFAVMFENSSGAQDMAGQMVTGGLLFMVDLTFLPGVVVLRGWARKRAAITRVVEQFAIRHAKCTVERDRQVVYRNVSALMRDTGHVPLDATEESALDAFDDMVKQLVPEYLQTSLGRGGLPYSVAFAGSFPLVWGFGLDMACADIGAGGSPGAGGSIVAEPPDFALTVLFWMTMAVSVFPLPLALAMRLGSKWLELRPGGFCECVYAVVIWSATSSLLGVMVVAQTILWGGAVQSATAAWITSYLAFLCTLVAITWVVFRPFRITEHEWHRRKQTCKGSTWKRAESMASGDQ